MANVVQAIPPLTDNFILARPLHLTSLPKFNINVLPSAAGISNTNDYCSPHVANDAILTISSSDGMRFRVHSIIMQMASNVFMDMINGAKDTGEAIPLTEKSEIVKALLDIIHPNGIAISFIGKKFEYVWSLLAAADKYDIRKITDEIRVRLLSDPYFKSYPLESYAIACRYSWKDEIAATTLGALFSVDEPKSWKIFAELDAIHIIRLHKLIEMRRVFVSKAIRAYDNIYFSRGVYYTSNNCDETLFSLIELELVKCPSGSTLQEKFWTRSDLRNLIPNDSVRDRLKTGLIKLLKDLPSKVHDIPA